MTRTAVVLFNLGGPDTLGAVEPFLFNLFNDPAIISLPQPLRWCLARYIAKKRGPTARAIYEQLGGGSPLVEQTRAQAEALSAALGARDPGRTFTTTIAMNYWHPMSIEAAEQVRDFGAEEVVLLPLYPQFSTTTTGSSLKAWERAARAVGLRLPTRALCCYPVEAGWIEAQRDLIAAELGKVAPERTPRILFSAHGLPKKVIARGDPYQWQVERTCEAVVAALGKAGQAAPDWSVCYQSRVGPLEWIGPSTEDELERAARDGVPVVVVPIAFVSEHSETLVELDIEYRELAHKLGIPAYHRVPVVGTHPAFIDGLAGLVTGVLAAAGGEPAHRPVPGCPEQRCPGVWNRCPSAGPA